MNRQTLTKTLMNLIQTPTHAIAKKLTESADIHDGDYFWYFKPRNMCNPEIVLVAHIDTIADMMRCRNVKPIPEFRDVRVTISGVEIDLIESGAIALSNAKHGAHCLGVDDRAGVVASIELWKKNANIGLLLTNYEESGARGAMKFCERYGRNPEMFCFDDLKIFAEIDRKGTKHYVDYVVNPQPVKEWVDGFGWEEERGTFSDVYHISSKTKIPSINIATGYYNEHSSSEHLILDEWFDAMEFTQSLITDISNCPKTRLKKVVGLFDDLDLFDLRDLHNNKFKDGLDF